MDHSANFLDDHNDSASIWPWVVGLLALIGMLLATAQTSKAIPASVASNVRQAIAAESVTGVTMEVNGRDVTLSGTLKPDVDKRTLIKRVSSASGVRTVTDKLSIYDPLAAAKKRAELFQSQLGSIDFSRLAFKPSSASLTPESLPALNALNNLLLQYPEQRVRVAGHTDNTGRPAVNLRISRQRADTVANYLISRGAATSQVVARGFGASRPIADNSTEAGRAKNRRIEIIYIN